VNSVSKFWRVIAVIVLSAIIMFPISYWGFFGASASALSGVRYPSRVAVFGDSLTFEAEPYYVTLIHRGADTALTYDSFGGTAICDWFPTMREVESRDHPRAVELEFSGNALTPCMRRFARPAQAYFQKYYADAEEAIHIFVPAGTHVYLVGAPVDRKRLGWSNGNTLNMQYARIAATDPQHVTYVDAGSAVEGPGHTYARTLPCLPIEPCTGPVVNSTPSNLVRARDGIHFCPVTSGNKKGVIARCPVYSSGAFRYARAMVAALATSV
jgi:hypothetical protein